MGGRGTLPHLLVRVAKVAVRGLEARQPEDREVELLVGMAEEEDQVVAAEGQADPQEVTGDLPRGATEDLTLGEVQVVRAALVVQEVPAAQATAEMGQRMMRMMEKIKAVVGRRVTRVISVRRSMRC